MIEIIKNILPTEINNKIILYLIKSSSWKIGQDYTNDLKLLEDLLGPIGKDYGMSFNSFNEKENIFLETPLNNYAEIVYEIIKKTTQYKFLKPIRFYWNYYNSSSFSAQHTDHNKDYYVSFIYNLNNNNGGTIINNEFYKSNSGEAIVFKSNLLHNSVSQTDVKSRFNLNCIVELKRTIN
jgi:hypothetical protein